MSKQQPSDSDAEDVDVADNSSPVAASQGVSDYEKQRLSRIADNRKRMEALGLHKMASSLMKGASLRSVAKSKNDKGKKKVDEDYSPNSEEELDNGDADGDEDIYVDEDDDDEDFTGSGSARKKGKSTPKSKKKKTVPVKKLLFDSDFVSEDDELMQGKSTSKSKKKKKKKTPEKKFLVESHFVTEDDELMQAIALSLQDSAETSGKRNAESISQRTKDTATQEDSRRGKRKKLFTSQVTMAEDDLALHFFQFDDTGKGAINVRDLEKVAISHDFIWSEKELTDMIRYFDGNNDGKLDLEDFRKIVQRCHMLQVSEGS